MSNIDFFKTLSFRAGLRLGGHGINGSIDIDRGSNEMTIIPNSKEDLNIFVTSLLDGCLYSIGYDEKYEFVIQSMPARPEKKEKQMPDFKLIKNICKYREDTYDETCIFGSNGKQTIFGQCNVPHSGNQFAESGKCIEGGCPIMKDLRGDK